MGPPDCELVGQGAEPELNGGQADTKWRLPAHKAVLKGALPQGQPANFNE